MDEAAYCDKNKVRGCASQVWLVIKVLRDEAGSPVLYLREDVEIFAVEPETRRLRGYEDFTLA